MTFEMLTGELLFNPRKDNNDSFGKNDDHLAQMMELLGRFPRKFTCRGTKARKYFSKEGNLNRIPKLQNWSLKDVMIAKYRFTEEQALFFEDFMSPMLNCYPERRLLADQMLSHPWLYTKSPENYFMYAAVYSGTQSSTRKSKPKDTIWKCRRKSSINTNRKTKTERSRTTRGRMKAMRTTNSTATRRWGTFI